METSSQDAAECRQHQCDAAVYHHQRDTVFIPDDLGANTPGHVAMGRCTTSATLDVPDDGQPRTACCRAIHGADFDRADPGPAVLADCQDHGYRSDTPGYHHGGEHGDRHDPPAGWTESVRLQSSCKNGPHRSLDRNTALGRRDAALPWADHLHPDHFHLAAASALQVTSIFTAQFLAMNRLVQNFSCGYLIEDERRITANGCFVPIAIFRKFFPNRTFGTKLQP